MKPSVRLLLVAAILLCGTLLAHAYNPPAGVEFLPDIPYRTEHVKQKLDILRPTNRSGPLPAILLVHGGGWREGRREEQRGIASRFAQAGYIAIPVGYRLTGEAPFPACLDDVVAAARWVRAHAKDYGIDPDRIGALGHSAGAHLVCMLALAEPAGKFAPGFLDGVSGRVNAVVATAAPTDFTRWGADHGQAGGTMFFDQLPPTERDAEARRCSPLFHADASAPPILLIQGSADRVVPPVQTERLIAALRTAKAPLAERVLLDGRPHDFILSHETLLVPMQISFFDRTIGKDAGRYAREIAIADDSRPARNNKEIAATWLAQFDTDGDGFVTRAEFPGGQELFERFDRAIDGKKIALASTAGVFRRTRIIGYSQVGQPRGGWFVADRIFESLVGNDRWELLWNGGADVDKWQDPAYEGWSRPLVSPCPGDTPVDRVLLSISGPYGSDEKAWADAINATINTIEKKLPTARQIVLQPVVGGPGGQPCPAPAGSQSRDGRIRASWQHAHISNAIREVVKHRVGATVSVIAGIEPQVRTCDDYADALGHLTPAGAAAAARAIGAHYATPAAP
ncbi:MAG: alpha/beta hydrolase [Opitutaceae bacterium]|nr:alpha/beta hydrolase [Opitutaceae bacterium]